MHNSFMTTDHFLKLQRLFSQIQKQIGEEFVFQKVLPNNQFIINVIEKNKNLKFPWDVYRQMLAYKTHADSFRENCFSEEKVNDYKQFPPGFNYFVKTKFGIPVEAPQSRAKEEIDFRMGQVETLFNKFLHSHNAIVELEKRDLQIFYLKLQGGRELKVFITHTYSFTEYSLERICDIDPGIDAILCLNPSSTHSIGAKRTCIEKGIALHSLSEFMAAINFNDDRFLDCLTKKLKNERIDDLKKELEKSDLDGSVEVYVFGSYLRHNLYEDVDILVVHEDNVDKTKLDYICSVIRTNIKILTGKESDLEIIDKSRFPSHSLIRDNKVRIY